MCHVVAIHVLAFHCSIVRLRWTKACTHDWSIDICVGGSATSCGTLPLVSANLPVRCTAEP